MLINILEPNFIFNNDCGKLIQLVREGWKQVNVIFSYANSERGGHYHKINREAFYVVSGKFELTVVQGGITEKYTFTAGDMFEILPLQMHFFKYLEDTTLIALYDRGVELKEGEKDIYSHR